MRWACPEDPSEVFDDGASMCAEHTCPLVEVAEEPPGGATTERGRTDGTDIPVQPADRRKGWSRDRCWRCSHEAAPGNTQCTRLECGRSLTPPALYIEFAGGEVEVSEGVRVELGRLGSYQRVFRDHPNVSRAHAAVRVDADGTAWIEALPTPNGTFLNGAEIQPPLDRQLASGDRIRFGRDVEGSITLYRR
ncbi:MULTISPECIES: FHA domain-containing protein [Amycolatopsis]|uniref:FHA domain-containing protein n=1 Tax=Amycolatopsis dendrobii TaxID=2760662 RepID=A0A7W3ZEL8_9PSEU|nr:MULTISPECIES: FHA domain-containing protein [Amycolatopsis]MBB1158054.1 FHA domain-containing protein [Amycolatopsis dendrobii]UKD57152.1 FHA domain-containing protein [Amycolatopsis sp. FU40]